MDIQVATWKIVGIKPLIQGNPHKMWDSPGDEDSDLAKTTRKKGLRGSDKECFQIAKDFLYKNADGLYYHPAMAFWWPLLRACDGRRLGKAQALAIVTQAVAVIEEEFILYDPATLGSKHPKAFAAEGMPKNKKKWQIDFRRGINSNTKTAQGGVGIVPVRPKWKQWGGFLSLEVDMEFFKSLEGLTDLLNVAGHYYGIGVGRMRVKAVVKQKDVWSGLGMGKFSVEIMGG